MKAEIAKRNLRLKNIQMERKLLAEKDAVLVHEWNSLKRKYQEPTSPIERNMIPAKGNLLKNIHIFGSLFS